MKKITLMIAVIAGLLVGAQQAFAADIGQNWQPTGMKLVNNTIPVQSLVK